MPIIPIDFSDRKTLQEYYAKIDLSFWDMEVSRCLDLMGLEENLDHGNVIRLYSTYLQLIEVFFLNVFAITENNLAGLFLDNTKLREAIETQAKLKEYKCYFFENWVFGVIEKHLINNYDKKYAFYSKLYDELIDDYLKDYDLLNAYKHGFRTHATGPVQVSLFPDGKPDKIMSMVKYDSSIVFFSKGTKKDKNREMVYESVICFNWRYIAQKTQVILSMLENTRKILMANGEKVELTTLFDTGSDIGDLFGSFRMRNPAYVLHERSSDLPS